MNIKIKGLKLHVNSSREMYIIMKAILKRENKVDRNREHLWTISLNSANKILNIELVSMGSVNSTVTEPMEVFSIPLQKRAVLLVLVHNHPSETMKPSAADKDVTDRLIQCGLMLHVPVYDHIIIGKDTYYSFRESGLMEELEKSTKYVPSFILKERVQKQVEEAVKLGKEETKISLAQAMIKSGEPVKKIMEYTGLSRKAIGELK